ncbi:MAG: RNA polymerase sigma factor [Bacteroidota bacterium]|nr:RNA polymerase sigma factor [Bacteroidota bacterium]
MADFNIETLNELLVQCIDKQPKAQKKLFDILSPRMFAICLRYSQNEDEAKDLLQEGFIKIFNNLEQFSNKGSLEGWIKRIFINTCIEFHRKNQKHRFLDNIENVTEISIDSQTLSLLKKADLMKLVQKLPKGYRTVFNLFVVDGYGHSEIAEMLNVSENTSKTQLFRARQILQEIILKQDLK